MVIINSDLIPEKLNEYSIKYGFKVKEIEYFDGYYITSTNETTQIVLGGYFIKAMAENVIKEKKIKFNKKNNVANNDESYSDDE